jgi:hypothetical protein
MNLKNTAFELLYPHFFAAKVIKNSYPRFRMSDLERLRALLGEQIQRFRAQIPVARQQLLAARERIVRPLTPETLVYHYLPLQGLVSYSVLSLNVMTPRLCGTVYAR